MRPAFARPLFSNWERTTTGRATEIYTNIYSLLERERSKEKRWGKGRIGNGGKEKGHK